MIASTMPLLTIHHKTEYRYTHPAAFGKHRVMLRPRDGHDLRVLESQLEIEPPPSGAGFAGAEGPGQKRPASDAAALDPRRVRQQRGDRDVRRALRPADLL